MSLSGSGSGSGSGGWSSGSGDGAVSPPGPSVQPEAEYDVQPPSIAVTDVMAERGVEEPGPKSPMSHTEATIMLAFGVVGVATNLLVIVVIMSRRSLRKPSMGLLAHHCIIDLIKAALALPYAFNTYSFDGNPPAHCDVLGALYVVLVTVSFLNILCMVLNDSPTFPAAAPSNGKGGDSGIGSGEDTFDSHHCVVFGLTMIWFTGCIVNVGSFLTGTPGFNPDIGNCGTVYGPVRSYVTNTLWVVFNMFVILITGYQIRKLYKDLTASSNLEALRLVSLVTTMLSINSGPGTRENSESRRVRQYIQELEHEGLIRLRLFAILLLVQMVQWGPLFTLTVVDTSYSYGPTSYKVCTQLAYANACINPILLLVTYKNLRNGAKRLLCSQCFCPSPDPSRAPPPGVVSGNHPLVGSPRGGAGGPRLLGGPVSPGNTHHHQPHSGHHMMLSDIDEYMTDDT